MEVTLAISEGLDIFVWLSRYSVCIYTAQTWELVPDLLLAVGSSRDSYSQSSQ
jgi:hypothetical protein